MLDSINLDPDRIEDFYFPVNFRQIEDLVGKVLTQIEAMNMSPTAEKANKDIARQLLWKWWSDAQENSMTSYKQCIGPIYARTGNRSADDKSPISTWYTQSGVVDDDLEGRRLPNGRKTEVDRDGNPV